MRRDRDIDANASARALTRRGAGSALLQVAAAFASGVLVILGNCDSAIAGLVRSMLDSAAVATFIACALHLAIQRL